MENSTDNKNQTGDQTSQNDAHNQRTMSRRSYYGSVYPGIWLIIFGAYFLLRNFGLLPNANFGDLWPLFLIIPGLFMIFGQSRGKC